MHVSSVTVICYERMLKSDYDMGECSDRGASSYEVARNTAAIHNCPVRAIAATNDFIRELIPPVFE